MSFVSTLLQRFSRPEQGEQPAQVLYLPLPCPEHQCALVPERKENGEFGLYCPVCRLASQPQVRSTEPLAFQQAQERQDRPSRPGSLLHAMRAKNRFIERLGRAKNGRLVLLFDGNSRPQDTDALRFAQAPTVGELPKIRKASLPDVG